MTYNIAPWNFTHESPKTKIVKTEGHHIYTSEGEKLLDYTYSITFTLGYSNKEIIDEMYHELMNVSRCQVNRSYTTDSIDEMAQWICESGGWSGVAWGVSGTSAVEGAISMADSYWAEMGKPRKKMIITFPNGWHGTSYLTKGMGVPHQVISPSRRCIHINGASWKHLKDREAQEANMIQQVEMKVKERKDEIGSILFDPVPWFTVCEFSENFWRSIKKICVENDILMITDDVATGFGKMGSIHSHTKRGGGVRADISALGKAITAGHAPLSAIVCNKKVKDAVYKHYGYGHTYQPYMGGIGAMRAVKRILERDKLLEKVPTINGWLKNMGNHLLEKGLIESYRTSGIMMGIDLTDRYKANHQHQYGLSGKLSAVPNLYVCPPLIADEEYMSEITEKFTNIFS